MANSLIIPTMLGMLFAVSFAYPRGQPNYDNIPQCLQPKAPGLCLAYFQAFYYNPSTRKCESFIYGGCQGNANRFSTLEECLDKCGDFEPETKEFKLIHESDEEQKESKEKVIASEDNQNSDEEHSNEQQVDPCKLPVKMGPCRAMFPRFYFNGEKCESFIYGGCQGNKNNFKTIEDCQRRCESNSEEKKAQSEEATA